jgi:hypothetical protein
MELLIPVGARTAAHEHASDAEGGEIEDQKYQQAN